MLREDFLRRLEIERLSAVMVLAAGGEIDIPEWDVELARFEAALDEPPVAVDPVTSSQQAVRLALGLSAVPERV